MCYNTVFFFLKPKNIAISHSQKVIPMKGKAHKRYEYGIKPLSSGPKKAESSFIILLLVLRKKSKEEGRFPNFLF